MAGEFRSDLEPTVIKAEKEILALVKQAVLLRTLGWRFAAWRSSYLE